MVKYILVPIDGSDHAESALELAADLAARYDAKMHVLHVLLRGEVPDQIRALSDKQGDREPPIAVGGGFVDASLPVEVLQDIAEKLLQRARDTAHAHGAREVECTWHQGDAAPVILQQAQELEVDMIVMGSRGLGDLKGLMVGSVSHKIAHLFEGSVVTVK